MQKAKKKSGLSFEPGSKQPFALYLISIIIISALITIIALASSGLAVKLGASSSLGDVNGDGVINSGDSLLLMKYLVGQSELNETQRGNADVDKNEALNSKDALLILQFSNGSSEKIGTPATANENIEAPTEPVSTQSKPSGGNQTESASQEVAATEKEYERSGVSDDAAYFSTDKNIYFTARITNKWKDASGKNMYQIEVKIKNNSAKSMYNTSAYISFSSPAEVGKSWSCSTKSGSQAIKITTNNESTLYPGGTFGCGFTVSSDSSDLKISYFAKEKPSSETTSQ